MLQIAINDIISQQQNPVLLFYSKVKCFPKNQVMSHYLCPRLKLYHLVHNSY